MSRAAIEGFVLGMRKERTLTLYRDDSTVFSSTSHKTSRL